MPWASALYACDAKWWNASGPPAGAFEGRRYSTNNRKPRIHDNKEIAAAEHRLTLLEGHECDGFCFVPGHIHYGGNSGFQAINLALQFGARKIWLIGFDMHNGGGKNHFFGEHPASIAATPDYRHYVGAFVSAARMLPMNVEIINATPGSALPCFKRGQI